MSAAAHVTVDEVCTAFATALAGARARAVPASADEIAVYETALGTPLPAEYRDFCARFGRGTGPFTFRGAHVGLDTDLTRVAAAWQAKRARRKRKGETGPPRVIPFGLVVGTCQDCGPAVLVPGETPLPREVRALLPPPAPGHPAVVQVEDWKGDRLNGMLLAESLAALVFGEAFAIFVLGRCGPGRHGSLTLPPGARAKTFGADLDAALAPLGFARHPQSRFALAWHLVHASGRAAIAIRPDAGIQPPGLALTIAGGPQAAVDAACERLGTLARVRI